MFSASLYEKISSSSRKSCTASITPQPHEKEREKKREREREREGVTKQNKEIEKKTNPTPFLTVFDAPFASQHSPSPPQTLLRRQRHEPEDQSDRSIVQSSSPPAAILEISSRCGSSSKNRSEAAASGPTLAFLIALQSRERKKSFGNTEKIPETKNMRHFTSVLRLPSTPPRFHWFALCFMPFSSLPVTPPPATSAAAAVAATATATATATTLAAATVPAWKVARGVELLRLRTWLRLRLRLRLGLRLTARNVVRHAGRRGGRGVVRGACLAPLGKPVRRLVDVPRRIRRGGRRRGPRRFAAAAVVNNSGGSGVGSSGYHRNRRRRRRRSNCRNCRRRRRPGVIYGTGRGS